MGATASSEILPTPTVSTVLAVATETKDTQSTVLPTPTETKETQSTLCNAIPEVLSKSITEKETQHSSGLISSNSETKSSTWNGQFHSLKQLAHLAKVIFNDVTTSQEKLSSLAQLVYQANNQCSDPADFAKTAHLFTYFVAVYLEEYKRDKNSIPILHAQLHKFKNINDPKCQDSNPSEWVPLYYRYFFGQDISTDIPTSWNTQPSVTNVTLDALAPLFFSTSSPIPATTMNIPSLFDRGIAYQLNDVKLFSIKDYNIDDANTTIIVPNITEKNSCTLDEFKYRMKTDVLMSDIVDLDMSNIVVAGGSVARIILNHPYTSQSDIDIFLVEDNKMSPLTIEVATTKLESIRQYLIKKWGSENLTIFRTEKCVTFFNHTNSKQVQVILRLYESKMAVINDFDLGSCSVVYDGEDVYFNSLGKFAYETGLNIYDLRYQRYSYEARIVKYMARGFGMMFKNLSLKTVANYPYNVKIGKLNFHYLQAKTDGVWSCSLPTITRGKESSMQNSSEYGGFPYHSVSEISLRNYNYAVKMASDASRKFSASGLCAHVKNTEFKDFQSISVDFNGMNSWLSIYSITSFERALKFINDSHLCELVMRHRVFGHVIDWKEIVDALIEKNIPNKEFIKIPFTFRHKIKAEDITDTELKNRVKIAYGVDKYVN